MSRLYRVLVNQPGYLPVVDEDDSHGYETFSEAQDALLNELETTANSSEHDSSFEEQEDVFEAVRTVRLDESILLGGYAHTIVLDEEA